MKYVFLLKRIRQQAKYFVILALSGLSMVVTHETPAFAQNTTSLLPSIDKITIRPQLEQQPLRRSRRLGGGYGLPLGSASVLLWNDSFCDTYSSTPIIFNCSNDLEEYRQHRTELLSTISPDLAVYLERSGTTHEEHLRQRLILHTEDEYAKSCLYMQEEEDTIQAYPLTITSSSGARTRSRYYQIRLTVSPNLTTGIGEWYLVSCSILPQAVIPAIIAGNFPSETAEQPVTERDNISQQSAQTQQDIDPVDCGDDEIQMTFDDSSPNYHQYFVQNEICPTSLEGCTKEFVFSTMLTQVQFIAPTENHTPVENCTIYNVNLPWVLGRDTIRTIIRSNQDSIINYTRRNHFLHPGAVTRTVIEKDGGIYVVTFGQGTGLFPELNENGAQDLWTNQVDNKLTEEVLSRLSSL